jgi:hypothetical protein
MHADRCGHDGIDPRGTTAALISQQAAPLVALSHQHRAPRTQNVAPDLKKGQQRCAWPTAKRPTWLADTTPAWPSTTASS